MKRLSQSDANYHLETAFAESFVQNEIFTQRRSFNPKMDHFEYDLMKNSEIHLHFPYSCLRGIQEFGFLNVYEINTDLHLFYRKKELRAQIESRMAGYDFTENPNQWSKLLPKYARLNIKLPSCFQIRHEAALSFGCIVAVLNDKIKDRASITPYDSIIGYQFGFQPHEDLFSFDQRKIPILPRQGVYFEVQIWGPLFLDDVKEILIPEKKYWSSVGFDFEKQKAIESIGLNYRFYDLAFAPNTYLQKS